MYNLVSVLGEFMVQWGQWKWKSLSHVLNSLWPQGLYNPWNSPGQNTGVGSLSLLRGIFPTQGWNPGLLHCRQIPYQLSHKGSPLFSEERDKKRCFFFFGGLRLGWAVGPSGTNRSAVVSAVGAASSSFWRWRWAPFLKERQEEVGSLLSRGGSTRGGHKRDHMCSWALPRP